MRTLPPDGGGADTPGSVASRGRTELSARSCTSASLRVGLENTSWPIGIDPASNRTMNGGSVPAGMNDRERSAIATTCANA